MTELGFSSLEIVDFFFQRVESYFPMKELIFYSLERLSSFS